MAGTQDIFEFAMKMEVDGREFYLKLMNESTHPGVKAIFKMMADDELKHYNTFKSLSAKSTPEMRKTTVLKDAKNVFQDIAVNLGQTGGKIDVGAPQVEHYRSAEKVEKESYELYESKAKLLGSGPQHDLLMQIAKEERAHELLMHNLIEFVSRPETWISDAEFSHIGEDY